MARPARACVTEKRRFPDKKSAVRRLHEIWNTSHRDVLPRRAYECPYCDGWHLTHLAPPGDELGDT